MAPKQNHSNNKIYFYVKDFDYIDNILSHVKLIDAEPYNKSESYLYNSSGKYKCNSYSICKCDVVKSSINIERFYKNNTINELFLIDNTYLKVGEEIFNISKDSYMVLCNQKIYNINTNIQFVVQNENFNGKENYCCFFIVDMSQKELINESLKKCIDFFM